MVRSVFAKAVYPFGFRLALVYWRVAGWLDNVPGFNAGTTEAYNRDLQRAGLERDE
jgi:hypothetical protein